MKHKLLSVLLSISMVAEMAALPESAISVNAAELNISTDQMQTDDADAAADDYGQDGEDGNRGGDQDNDDRSDGTGDEHGRKDLRRLVLGS